MLSTASVSGDRKGLVLEQDLQGNQSFRTVVEETKAHAERIARRAMGKVPIVVLRPSTMIGDSETGEVDRFDGPYPLILLILSSPHKVSIPLPIRGDLPLNLVPIDFVVRAAHRVGSDPRAPGRTIHLVDPSPLPARRVFELVAHVAGRRSPQGVVPSHVARTLMRTPGLDRVAKSPRAYLQQMITDVRHDTRNAEELLRGTGVVCPPFESYVDRIVNYVRTRIRQQRQREADATQAVDDPLS
jgi:nucleoside-diphosphate-sugar epimerase